MRWFNSYLWGRFAQPCGIAYVRDAETAAAVHRLLAQAVVTFFAFQGGLEYIVWKLERQSGTRIEVSERVRRYPLIFAWGLFWRLYRRGIFH